jgi:deoxyribodipyrimidine photo-lyase
MTDGLGSQVDENGGDQSGHDPAIVWFRQDLRISDNLALSEAVARGNGVVALYVLDEQSAGLRPLGGAQRWWLHHSLVDLAKALRNIDIQLVLRRGKSADALRDVIKECGAGTIVWNRRYDPAGVAVDTSIKAGLRDDGLTVHSFGGHLLHEPSEVRTGTGDAYKVYSPFWRALQQRDEPREPLAPCGKASRRAKSIASDKIGDWALLPKKPDWSAGISDAWTPGEKAAAERLDAFIGNGFSGYKDGRDVPGIDGTSRLSPHLAFGEITPYQIWHATKRRPNQVATDDRVTFRKEVVWREFAYHLLYHFKDLPKANFNDRFDHFPWASNADALRRWTKGQTGYPIVDAGMRQLWNTGWMHNRVRMICASFLTKHLLIDWRKGEDWFWDTLVDADQASNAAQWQWVAGSGADAAPYFRIFNPILQGIKFDPDGDYVRQHVPELRALDSKFIHKPWEAPDDTLAAAQIRLGETYPKPIVDHHQARQRALDAYTKVKEAA